MLVCCRVCSIFCSLVWIWVSFILLRFFYLYLFKYIMYLVGIGQCIRFSFFSFVKCCSTFMMFDVEMTLSQNTRERRREQQYRAGRRVRSWVFFSRQFFRFRCFSVSEILSSRILRGLGIVWDRLLLYRINFFRRVV